MLIRGVVCRKDRQCRESKCAAAQLQARKVGSRAAQDDVLDSSDEEVQVTRVMEGGVEEGAAQALTQLSRGDAPAER